jgi:hypothetical protein
LDSGSTSCASSLLPIATPRPSSGQPRTRLPAGLPRKARQELCPLSLGALSSVIGLDNFALGAPILGPDTRRWHDRRSHRPASRLPAFSRS